MQRIYFDNAATTALDSKVLDSMLPYMQENYGNPSSIHSFGREARTAIEKARKTVATLIHASPGEVFFTSCGTESNNTAIRRSIEAYNIKHIISTEIEHHCVLDTCLSVAKKGAATVHYVKLDNTGRISLSHLEQLLGSIGEKCLVSIMHANNEVGTINPIEEIGDLCKRYDALFHTDSVQTIAHYPIDLSKLNIHFLSGSAHKFHGPKGAGFLYINRALKIEPLIYGGSQERNMRAGTENVYGIIGLGAAMELACKEMDKTSQHIKTIKTYLMGRLEEGFEDVRFNGDAKGNSLYTVLNVSFPANNKSTLLLFNLDMNGVCASSGSACTSGSDKGSHVLEALGVKDDRVAIRFSFSKHNSVEEVDVVVQKLKELLALEVVVG